VRMIVLRGKSWGLTVGNAGSLEARKDFELFLDSAKKRRKNVKKRRLLGSKVLRKTSEELFGFRRKKKILQTKARKTRQKGHFAGGRKGNKEWWGNTQKENKIMVCIETTSRHAKRNPI